MPVRADSEGPGLNEPGTVSESETPIPSHVIRNRSLRMQVVVATIKRYHDDPGNIKGRIFTGKLRYWK